MIDTAGMSAIELPLTLLGGLLGSSHCIGMCGGFAISVGIGAESFWTNLLRQLLWSCGRLFTYAFAGATAGFLSWRVGTQYDFTSLQASLALLAGTLLIVQGSISTGIIRRRRKAVGPCPIDKLSWLLPIGQMLKPSTKARAPGIRAAETFLAGIMTGLLPCGLVYAYLALAAASSHIWSGMAIMTAFGVGTMPMMITTGVGASLLSIAARAKVFKYAAWCVIATGVLTLGRGFAAIQFDNGEDQFQCPMCRQIENQQALPTGNR